MSSVSLPRSQTGFIDGAWSPEDSERLYGVSDWGQGYVAISPEGNVLLRPDRKPARSIDLHELVEGLRARGLHTPILLRFSDVLRHRLGALKSAFDAAIKQEDYKGQYCCVYPIKVNQQRHVVEEIRDVGTEMGFGLEAGSKPELLAVLGMTADHPDMPIVCNGFKDAEYVEMVILAAKLGRRIIPVVEKFSELELIVAMAERYDVRPSIGVRVKLASRGQGRWESSGGVRSKFGLFVTEILKAAEYLEEHGMLDCLNLVHAHIGSQICDIRRLKNAINELAYVYVGLREMGANVTMIDVGGGLAVDYDGSQTAFDSSMNYTIEEYAADIVYRIKAVCDDSNMPHPTIVSESGRAMVAYSSVLVFDVLGVSCFDTQPSAAALKETESQGDDTPQPLLDLKATYENISDRNLIESYHDAMQARDEVMSLFTLGYLSLKDRGLAEQLFWSIGRRILDRAGKMKDVPEEFSQLPELLSDQYFCNFSLFQSLPDSWAIDQIFPILPLHRHTEEPTREAILADVTCDSDGKVDRFVDRRDIRRTIPLHPLKAGKPYYLAAFLVGAYQEILGDLHNLFGDTHAIHVSIDEEGEVSIDEVIKGDRVSEVLEYVQINPRVLRREIRREAERAVKAKKLTVAESGSLVRFFEEGLDGYTYLEE